ncbi:hypothetical protein DF112_24720 [Burkholderia stagnalis]|nr:hypothetical protein DF112_24720 [Burkholderia stagnalis]
MTKPLPFSPDEGHHINEVSMTRSSSTKHHAPSHSSKPSSSSLASLGASSVIENIKQTALPKEVSFGVYFSYKR